MKRRIFAFLLVFALIFTGAAVPSEAAPLTEQEKAEILAQRRDIAEAHMRQITSTVWRCGVDVLYTISQTKIPEDSTVNPIRLQAGRLYRGMPYSYSGGSWGSWMELASEPDEKGIYTVSDLNWLMLSGGSAYGRFGTDCSGSVCQSWSQIGSSNTFATTGIMSPSRGYLRVGEYVSSNTVIDDDDLRNNNTDQVMYAAYAQLQKADAIVHDGHVRMAVSVDVVYADDGVTIDGEASTVTCLEQTTTYVRREDHYYDETLGENVYDICGVDKVFTFQALYNNGYRPITCLELIDATAGTTPPIVTDSLSSEDYGFDTLLSGTLTTKNWVIDTVTMTITDKTGKTVQEGIVTAPRSVTGASRYQVPMSRFEVEAPSRMLGYIAPDALTAGDYHCKVVCRLSTGQEFTVRDFDFAVTTTKNDIHKTELDFTQGAVHDCPMCGEKSAQWQPLTTAHVGANNGPASGHYYLAESMEGNTTYIPITGATVCLYLNGKNITSTERALHVGESAVLNIMGSGTVTGTYCSTNFRGVAIDASNSTVNLYGGTYRHNKGTSQCPIIGLRDSAHIRMYEGAEIVGDKNVSRSSVLSYKGRFEMYGGLVTDGYGSNGGNFLIGYSGTTYTQNYLSIYGGTVKNGHSTGTAGGGNIYGVYDAYVYIRGGTVTGGEAVNGGNICVNKGANLQITGGTVKDGTASGLGDNIYVTNTENTYTGTMLQDCGAVIYDTATVEDQIVVDNNAFLRRIATDDTENPEATEPTEATEATEATEPTEEPEATEDPESQRILAQRRDIAEAHMREIVSMIWRCEVDMHYTMSASVLPENASENFTLRAGRLYRGLPYSFSGGSLGSWKDLISEPDENGVYTASDLNWQMFSGSASTGARFGTDCSGAVSQSWSQFGASTQFQATSSMSPSRGYLRVGEYVSSNTTVDDDDLRNNNTDQVMYAAYAQLQKADALVHDGHVRMAVSTNVVYEDDGVTIDGEASTVTILEQGRGPMRKDAHYYDETLGEEVYEICGIDVVVTFKSLYNGGYRPITCLELIDATAGPAAPEVKDSLSSEDYGFDTLLSGTLTTKGWAMDTATMTITDETGKTVQEGMITAPRSTSNSSATRYKLPLSRFTVEAPTRMLGYIAPDVLTAGNYHCKLVCRLTTGQEFTVRDFDFEVTTTKNDVHKTKIDFTQGTVHDCPMCGEKAAQWKPLTTAHVGSGNGPAAGHYYLSESMENNTSYIAISGVNVCLHLNGKNINSTKQALSLTSSAVLNIMGDGIVKGSYPSTESFGAALHVSESTVNLYGGTCRRDVAGSSARPIVDIRGSGKINMYDGAKIEGNKSIKRSSVLIYKGRFNMYGGEVIDGYGTNGGNFLVGYSNAYNLNYLCIYGGKVTNGTGSGMGGNIYGVYDSFVFIHGGEITGGTAVNGGNLAVNKGANIRITGGTISGGTASGQGDGIYATNTTTPVTSKTEKDETTGALITQDLYLQDCGAIVSANAQYEGETYAENNAFIKIESAPALSRGDMNGDGKVSDADAMYLLRYTLFGETRYPLNQSGDVNGDDTVSDADAMYLLRYTLFGETRYPLH